MLATIGYESANLSDFIATLHLGGVDILVDIRDRAQSRRKGFSKTALSEELASAGIGYVHYRELGDPPAGRDAARRGDFDRFRRIFGEVMETEKAREALAQLQQLALENRICLMCYERDETTCHRKIVADHLQTEMKCKTKHLGVRKGAAGEVAKGQLHNPHQSAAA